MPRTEFSDEKRKTERTKQLKKNGKQPTCQFWLRHFRTSKKIKATTNKKGVAIFKIKKNVIKKLKVGKKYKYSVTYLKETVTKKVTVKK